MVSAGKEGPCAQIDAGLASIVAGFLQFDEHDRKQVVICDISVGSAPVSGTPIAGSISEVETLFVATMLYGVLLPSFIAGITAYQGSSALGLRFFFHPVKLLLEFSEVFLLKPLFTSMTLNLDGSLTPFFFTGATSGMVHATMMGLNTATFSVMGLASVLADCANTPIAASMLSVELFGPVVAPHATVACVISFLMTGHRSVYHSQSLSMHKSEPIQVEIGKEMAQRSSAATKE